MKRGCLYIHRYIKVLEFTNYWLSYLSLYIYSCTVNAVMNNGGIFVVYISVVYLG